MGITENYQYNFLLNNTVYKKIELTKTIAKNSYNYLKNESLQDRITLTKNNVNKIVKILDTLKRLKFKNYKAFLLDYIIHQYNGDIAIVSLNKKVIMSKNLAKIGTNYNLPCNPFKNYGECSVIINNKFHYVKYSPNYRFFIECDFKINSSYKPKITSKIIQLLKTIPDIIIFYNRKQLTGTMSPDSFYIFDEIKTLNIFFGYGVKYNTIEKMSNTINEEVLAHLKPLILNFIFLGIGGIILFYAVLFTLFKKQFRIIEIAIRDYEKKALMDKLTNTLNRNGFEKAMQKCNYKYFILLDLDNFKYINDNFGHEAGDAVLKEFAWLLKKYFKNDIIGRWGGDEFLICTNKEKEQITEIFDLINKELTEIQKQIDSKMEKRLSISAGICDRADLDMQKRFTNADLALYKVKKTQKGRVLFYNDINYIKMEKEDLQGKY
jgi:diguanylate cyclase (GGDEF)-like protein